MKREQLRARLRDKGLKATPRRVLILEAIMELNNHPAADEIVKYIRNRNLNVATATVYKALDIMVAKNVINKVETEKNRIRYDAIPEPHHHLISTETGLITDYQNDEIHNILREYFEKNKIDEFEIEEFKLQITGKFKKQ